ncbi:MAG: flagellar export chaperone FlgN [Microthrixaceae bacterium]
MARDSDFDPAPERGTYRRNSRRDSFAAHMIASNGDGHAHKSPAIIPQHHLVELVLSELSHVLWQQRDLVTQLIYRLEVQRLLLTNSRSEWVEYATSDVNDALDDVRRQEEFRTELLVDLSSLLGTRPDASLRDLIGAVSAPWDTIFSEHHAAFLKLSADAEEASRVNSDLIQRGLADLGDLLTSFGHEGESAYSARAGRSSTFASASSEAVLVDRDA